MTVRRLIPVLVFCVLAVFVVGCGDQRSPTAPADCCDKPVFVPVKVIAKATAYASVRVVCESGTVINVHVEAEGSFEGYTREGETEAQAIARLYPQALQKAEANVLEAKAKVSVDVVCKSGGLPPVPPTPQPPTPGPTQPCSIDIDPTYLRFPYNGDTKEVRVIANRSDCSWTATGNSWAGIQSGHSGTGNGSVSVKVTEHNTSGSIRRILIQVAGKTVTVDQDPAPTPPGPVNCVVSDWSAWSAWTQVSATSEQRTRTRQVITPASNGGVGCPALSETESRTIVVTPCEYVVGSGGHYAYQGGNGGFSVSATRSDCGWTAVSNNPSWLTVRTGASGSGNGSVNYDVAPNTGAARTGTFTAAGKTVTVTQDAAPTTPTCTYAVQETPQSYTHEGGNGGFSVSASASNCSWNAVSSVFWIEVKTGASGSGNGSVTYVVAGNGGGARTGTITVGGKTITITQAAKP